MKNLFTIPVVILISSLAAYASDQELLTTIPSGSTVHLQINSAAVSTSSYIGLGRINLISGSSMFCELYVFQDGVNKPLDGKLLINIRLVHFETNGDFFYELWGDYFFNSLKKDYYNMTCRATRAPLIGDFREYLKVVNGSLSTP